MVEWAEYSDICTGYTDHLHFDEKGAVDRDVFVRDVS